jgi:hypothetical protein
MLFGRYEISLLARMILADGIYAEKGLIVVGCERSLPSILAIMRLPCAIFCVLFLNYRLRFSHEIVCFFAAYFSYERS